MQTLAADFINHRLRNVDCRFGGDRSDVTNEKARQIAKNLLVSLTDVIKRLRTPTVPGPYLLEYENTVAILSMKTGEDLNRFKVPKEAIKQQLFGLQEFGVRTCIYYDPSELYCDTDYLLAKIESLVAHIDENDSLLETELLQ